MIDAPLAIGATVFLIGLGIYVVAELVRQYVSRAFEAPVTSQREPLWTADTEMLKLTTGTRAQAPQGLLEGPTNDDSNTDRIGAGSGSAGRGGDAAVQLDRVQPDRVPESDGLPLGERGA